MGTAHNGVVTGHEPGFRFDNIRIVPQNLAFNAPDAISPGLRTEGLCLFDPTQIADVAARNIGLHHEAKITFDTLQCTPLYLRNYAALSQILVDAQMQHIGGGATAMKYYTFKDNPAAFGVQATGTTSLAFGFKFTINNTKASALLSLNSFITSILGTDELPFLFSSSDTALAAGTGGTTLGLTTELYDRASVIVPPLDYVTISNSGGGGALKAGKLGMTSEFTFETFTGEPDGRNRGIAQGVKLGGKLRIVDLNKTQAIAYLTDFSEDVISCNIFNKSGHQYQLLGGAASLSPHYRISEKPKDSWIEIDIAGDIPLNPVNQTVNTTYIDWGTTSPNIISFKLAGYN